MPPLARVTSPWTVPVPAKVPCTVVTPVGSRLPLTSVVEPGPAMYWPITARVLPLPTATRPELLRAPAVVKLPPP